MRQFRLCLLIASETVSCLCLRIRLIAFGIHRWVSTLRRSEGNRPTSIFESVVGRGEFFQPESRSSARGSQLIVRSQNHQNSHNSYILSNSRFLPTFLSPKAAKPPSLLIDPQSKNAIEWANTKTLRVPMHLVKAL